jgi:hypothetical protein
MPIAFAAPASVSVAVRFAFVREIFGEESEEFQIHGDGGVVPVAIVVTPEIVVRVMPAPGRRIVLRSACWPTAPTPNSPLIAA